MSLFGKDATSFSHLDLGILCHSSFQILSSSVRLDGKRWWTAIFRSLQRCSIGFKSGLWLGHSRTVTELLWSHSFVILAVCLGSLSCWKVNLRPSLRSWALWRRFSSRTSLYLAAFIFPSIAPVVLSLQLKKPPQHDAATTMLHCWDCMDRWWAVPGFLHTYRLELRPKVLSWSHQTRESFRCFFSKLHAGFHVSCTEERLPSGHSAIKPRLVEGCSDGWTFYKLSPISRMHLWSSATVIFGFFFTSLTKALLPR